jgi:hypothetical protein
MLHGIYQPVPAGSGPKSNLRLTTVNLNDGSCSTTQIYPVFGIGGNTGEDNLPKKPIGAFYVQFAGNLCVYDLPRGLDCDAMQRCSCRRASRIQRPFNFQPNKPAISPVT